MKKAQLDEIEKRTEAATPGPWEDRTTGYTKNGLASGEPYHRVMAKIGAAYFPVSELIDSYDAAFIAHARIDIPALIAEIKSCWKRIAQLESMIDNGEKF
jgi:hypothetical protein